MLARFLSALRWRYAVKIFDPGKKLAAKDLNALLEAARLSPSSLGLQPFKIVVVENKAARQLVFEKACDQPKVVEAPYFLVFCTYQKYDRAFVDRFIDRFAAARHMSEEKVAKLRKARRAFITKSPFKELDEWAGQQAFLALGTLLSAAALSRIDACPMGGFKPAELDKVLNLQKYNLRSRVLCTLGYRASTDKEAKQAKVRRPLDELVVRIK